MRAVTVAAPVLLGSSGGWGRHIRLSLGDDQLGCLHLFNVVSEREGCVQPCVLYTAHVQEAEGVQLPLSVHLNRQQSFPPLYFFARPQGPETCAKKEAAFGSQLV